MPGDAARPAAARLLPSLAALLLADGRFPAGGHVHSGGVESAVADGRVTDLDTLEDFLRGRLWSAGLTEAALAVAAAAALGPGWSPSAVARLDAEADARVPAPPLRAASRKLGRQLVRVAGRCWPAPLLAALAQAHPGGVHQPVALGAVAVAAGLPPEEVAGLTVHHALTAPAQAAVRLLGLDPFAVAALTAALAGTAAAVAAEAIVAGHGPLDELPARTGPLVDLAAVEHESWDVRLFAT